MFESPLNSFSRMVGGPDNNLTGAQAGAIGESWSDRNAIEILNEYVFVPTSDENPFSVGAYVCNNKEKGIRNYALNVNPLNYSDIGYDMPGAEVHADGEVWNAVNFELSICKTLGLAATQQPAPPLLLVTGISAAAFSISYRSWQVLFVSDSEAGCRRRSRIAFPHRDKDSGS